MAFKGFTSWESVWDYMHNTLGMDYLDDPTGWNEAFKELTKGSKYVEIINETTGETYMELYPEEMVVGTGEWHIGENTTSSSSAATGGATSAPTAKSVVTNASGGGTAVVTDEAVAVKSNGLVSTNPLANIVGGLTQVYGLVQAGITIYNMQVWKDLANYMAQDTVLTEDDPVDKVIDFFKNRAVNTITDINNDTGDIRVSVPKSIAVRLYEFFSLHMQLVSQPGIFPEVSGLSLIDFFQRTFEFTSPTYSLGRYFSARQSGLTPYSYMIQYIDPSDDLFKVMAEDFVYQKIAEGFIIATSVGTALIASMSGVMAYLRTRTSGAVDECEICNASFSTTRDNYYYAPDKSTPIALSEILVQIQLTSMQDDLYTDEIDGKKYITHIGDNAPCVVPTSILESGYSYNVGDCCKYLKRAKYGDDDEDYAYRVTAEYKNSNAYYDCILNISYPSNEQSFSVSIIPSATPTGDARVFNVNGYTNKDYYAESIPKDGGSAILYSNLGWKGVGESYEPDDYLVTAGFKSRNSGGAPDKRPNPNKTVDEQFPEMTEKQQANPQAVTDPSTGTTVVNNITNYVSAAVPSGATNADRIINHGTDVTADPNAYIDNRYQDELATGAVNTNDPVDGFNEDVDRAIQQYNDTRTTPDYYPDPIPQNQPNPQYPTNPPADTSGDSGDTPTPSSMQGVTASGMCSVYNPTKQQLINFSSWLWSPNFLDNFLKIFQNPMDAIIGLHIMYATPITTTPANIICGYLDSGVSAKVVNQQFSYIDCGTVYVPEYYGTAIDYEPYTQIHAYLPFIGIVSLKPNDIIGKKLNIKYGVDAMTGTCLAILTSKLGDSEIACYTFAGNCATQIPVSGGSYAQMITGLAGMVAGGIGAVATANPLMAMGAAVSALNSHLDVSHSGSIGANAGAMGIRKPYLIITRKSAYDAANYGSFYGFPANVTVSLGSCKGYTRVKSVHVENMIRATDSEIAEIETLLKQGVIIQ